MAEQDCREVGDSVTNSHRSELRTSCHGSRYLVRQGQVTNCAVQSQDAAAHILDQDHQRKPENECASLAATL